MFELGYDGNKEDSSFKEVFSNTMEQILREDEQAVYLDADLMNSFGTGKLPQIYPDRAIDCGIQEANMIGVAAGMSVEGRKPYCHTFGVFASRRCFDQVFLSVGYAQNSVRIIGSDPGICAMYNGGTHMPFEDVGLYRTIPNAAIFEPCDTTQLRAILLGTKERSGVTYIRSQRKFAKKVYKSFEYQCGKANVLTEGNDAVIFAVGFMVAEALEAKKILLEEGIAVSVVDLVTIKPLDEDTVEACAKKSGAAVTCENSNIKGGVFGAISECLAARNPVPIEPIGIHDEFGEVGTFEYLQERYGLNTRQIVKAVKKVMARKIIKVN